jgi:hypothetical protein
MSYITHSKMLTIPPIENGDDWGMQRLWHGFTNIFEGWRLGVESRDLPSFHCGDLISMKQP